MSDHIQKTIEEALVKLREQEQQVIKTKTLINSLREWAGQPALFPDSETNSSTQTGPLRRDEYYGQALSTVVREVLVKRREAGLGPASVDEIYHAMLEGGYAFETSNEENAKRGLRISLTKNSATFHRLPQGGYGLKEWYPNIKESKARTSLTSAANGQPSGTGLAPELLQAQKAKSSEETEEFEFQKREEEQVAQS